MGDENFRKFLARFYRDFKGKRASFDDVRKTMEAVSGQDSARFFADWIERVGAPALAVKATAIRNADVSAEALAKAERRTSNAGAAPVEPRPGAYVIEGTIRQTQPGPPFVVDVPVVIQTTGKPVDARAYRSPDRLPRSASRRPTRRSCCTWIPRSTCFACWLHARETPPSLGQLFGDAAPLVVIAASEDPARAAAYRAMAESWKAPAHAPKVVLDTEVASLPTDRSVWLFGRDNRFAKDLVDGAAVRLDTSRRDHRRAGDASLRDHAAIVGTRDPGDVTRAVGWIVADRVDAMEGLGRKLPHYGKYSYLGFEGAEPVNMLKGQWQASDSPLSVDLRAGTRRDMAIAPLTLARAPLATLPAVFSDASLKAHVTTLASAE